jgi:hypothetical protein
MAAPAETRKPDGTPTDLSIGAAAFIPPISTHRGRPEQTLCRPAKCVIPRTFLDADFNTGRKLGYRRPISVID